VLTTHKHTHLLLPHYLLPSCRLTTATAAAAAPSRQVNFGKMVLDCAFAKWHYKLAQSMSQAGGPAPGAAGAGPGVPGQVLPGGVAAVPLGPPGVTSPQVTVPGAAVAAGGPPTSQSGALAGGIGGAVGVPEGLGGQPYYLEPWPKYWACRALPAGGWPHHGEGGKGLAGR
jgi:hypothetical protein